MPRNRHTLEGAGDAVRAAADAWAAFAVPLGLVLGICACTKPDGAILMARFVGLVDSANAERECEMGLCGGKVGAPGDA